MAVVLKERSGSSSRRRQSVVVWMLLIHLQSRDEAEEEILDMHSTESLSKEVGRWLVLVVLVLYQSTTRFAGKSAAFARIREENL